MPLDLTALDLITLACQESGICGQNGDLDGSDAAVALQHLNLFINSTGINRAVIYTIKSEILAMVSGQQDYTIGIDPTGAVTADWNTARPTNINQANVLIYSSSNTTRVPLQILSDAEWAAIPVQGVSGLPLKMYNDGGYNANGFSTIKFWPKPAAAYGFEPYTWQQNGHIAALTDSINYPPGYADYWFYGLALRLCPPFGKTVNPATLAQFRNAESRLASVNSSSPMMGADVGLTWGSRRGYTPYPWLIGPYR